MNSYSLNVQGGTGRVRWGGLIDRNFLIVSLAGAALAHFAADLSQPDLPYWGVASSIYSVVVIGFWMTHRRLVTIEARFETPAERRDRIAAMSLIAVAREARQLLADKTLFQRTPTSENSLPILEGVPESIRSVLSQFETIELIAGDFLLSRQSLAMLPNRQLQVGRWPSPGGERSLRVNLATGEASLWFHDADDDVEQETLPSVYHLIVLQGP
jgi:hypothetical protein